MHSTGTTGTMHPITGTIYPTDAMHTTGTTDATTGTKGTMDPVRRGRHGRAGPVARTPGTTYLMGTTDHGTHGPTDPRTPRSHGPTDPREPWTPHHRHHVPNGTTDPQTHGNHGNHGQHRQHGQDDRYEAANTRNDCRRPLIVRSGWPGIMITKIPHRIRCFIYMGGKIYAIILLTGPNNAHQTPRGPHGNQRPLKLRASRGAGAKSPV